MKQYFKYSMIGLIFFSCISEKKELLIEDGLLVNIMVEDSIGNYVDQLLLSDAIKDIEIIPLETTKKSVFRRAENISVGEDDLFVCTFETILRFDRQSGQFLNQIGRLGQGPTDVYYCSGSGLDDTRKWVYTLSAHTNEIKTFTYDGVWVKTLKAARTGAWMEAGSFSGADRTYCHANGKHIFRRMLPIQDGTKSLWQLGIMDSTGKYLYKITDPSCLGHQKALTNHSIGKAPINSDVVNYAIFSPSPIQNRYYNHINYLFSGNDTVYRYSEKLNVFKPRYILHCGKRPSFTSIHKMSKGSDYFRCLFVSDVLETQDFLYFVANQDVYSYLLRVDKKDGSMVSVRNKGEYKESSFWKVKYQEVETPGFTNDLCGGLDFYPYDQNEKQWIAIYDAADLLEKIDLEELKVTEVLMPDKKEQLIRILENLKEDDNPVVMIATLK